MNLSRHAPAPTRYAGIGLVVALHLAGIYALSVGLIKAPVRQPAPIVLKPLAPEAPSPVPPAKPWQAERPTLDAPKVVPVQTPDFIVESTVQSPSVTAVPMHTGVEATAGTGAGPARIETPPATIAGPRIAAPGAVCSVMPRPDVPAVQWSGDAVLNVLATVRGGRVTGSEVRVTQGALDAKTRRSLQRAVESALAGYQCQGDAVFQQDFAFRID